MTSTLYHMLGNTLGGDKFRDYNHLSGKNRGAANNKCNLAFQLPKFVPIVFHNLSGSNAHLFVRELGFGEGKINCIPNTDEKYIIFSKKVGDIEMRFNDSMRFLLSSIENLAKKLTQDKFKATQKCFDDHTELMIRKGIYRYDYVDSPSKLEKTQLPYKEAFYNKLSGDHISNEDYAHAQLVFKEFSCQTMRNYHNLYLESDVALLEDIFENFRDNCMKTHIIMAILRNDAKIH